MEQKRAHTHTLVYTSCRCTDSAARQALSEALEQKQRAGLALQAAADDDGDGPPLARLPKEPQGATDEAVGTADQK